MTPGSSTENGSNFGAGAVRGTAAGVGAGAARLHPCESIAIIPIPTTRKLFAKVLRIEYPRQRANPPRLILDAPHTRVDPIQHHFPKALKNKVEKTVSFICPILMQVS
jgi:hypothetical protein